MHLPSLCGYQGEVLPFSRPHGPVVGMISVNSKCSQAAQLSLYAAWGTGIRPNEQVVTF